ncbi:hypothetical protein SAMN05443637_104103 [Pseudonocardia thermophila]|uniref:Uncharacterized protein n=1 Tax=Pseudonocardia thermophila TaxID=1848 RepID=A0A1M6QZJ1_PSETH|nr:hypothetical protein SAMN05443637_104103 [Pseudonocardia thermophila]
MGGAQDRAEAHDQLPRVEAAIFLSDPGLQSHLDEVQRERVYGRDGSAVGVPWVWRDLLSRPPAREDMRITPTFSRDVLPKLLKEIGVRASTAHLRFHEDWVLRPELLDAGPMWKDRLAERHGLVDETGRVRIYLAGQNAGEEQRGASSAPPGAKNQVLQGTAHRGIAQAVDFREHQGRPAILFRHGPTDLRLDSYLAVHGERLGPDVRRDLAARLADPDGAAGVLAEPTRFVR